MEPILVMMAAGMGSRYGGMKQIDPIGPDGEVILDYSLFDAKRAGFKRVIFLIKHEMEEAFREAVGKRAEQHLEVSYAFQEKEMLPAGFSVPEGRVKPWGTGHAVLCCKDLIDAPFAAINADDYYGLDAFKKAYDYLSQAHAPGQYMMVGYHLRNTVSETGYVSRGVCRTDENGKLQGIREIVHIVSSSDGPLYTEDGQIYRLLDPESVVSMNLWGFTPDFLPALESGFTAFLRDEMPKNPLKAEYYLPFAVNAMIERGEASVQVLPSTGRWWGVTYREDKPLVQQAMVRMRDEGIYPAPLWK